MRRTGSALFALATTLGLLTAVGTATSCHKEPAAQTVAPLGASLELAAGEVKLEGSEGGERLLSRTPLPLGATLSTGPGARALIRLGDGTRVFMRDNTRLTLGDGLQLEAGHVWIEAPPLSEGRQATVHELGEVGVSISDGGASLSLVEGEAEVYVASGLAIVNANKRREVNPGERAKVGSDGEPTVEPVKFWDDWTGGMGDVAGASAEAIGQSLEGSGSLYAIDHMAGAAAMPLSIQRQTVKVVIDEQIAETAVDQEFFNPGGSEVEGYYWFTIPEDAMLVGFALEVDGELIEGEVVERRLAAAEYEARIVRAVDPALLEWIDARTVRARIYPIPAAGTRRVVVRYQQLLSETEGKLRYRYPMAAPAGRDEAAIEEFGLEVQLRGEMATDFVPATRSEARIEGRDRDRVAMRRSGYTPRADFELELNRRHERDEDRPEALRVDLLHPNGGGHGEEADEADYFMLRWLPDERLDLSKAEVPKGEVVVVVDTSAGSDPGEHQAKLAVAEALLRSLSESDRFALVSADLRADVLYPDAEQKDEDGEPKRLIEASPDAISEALERLAERGAGGATDLGAVIKQSLERVHGLEQPAVVYIGDGLATSGEVSGEALAEDLQRSLAGSRARLFTVALGREVDEALLTKLAEVGGGRSLRVDDPSLAVLQALELSGALKTPTITDLSVDLGEGPSQVMSNVAGKLSRGDELVLLARTHDELPELITVSGHFAGEDFSHQFSIKAGKDDAEKTRYRINREGLVPRMIPRLWARAYVDHLLTDTRGPDAVRGKVLTLGYDYGLMTPFTSFLVLDSEGAYRDAGIERRQRSFPQLTDGSWVSTPVDTRVGSPESPTVLSMFTAALLAPWGCAMEEAASEANVDADVPSGGGHAFGQPLTSERTPAPSATPITGKLQSQTQPAADPNAPAFNERGGWAGGGEDIPAREAFARDATTWGVFRLEAEKTEEEEMLAGAGIRAAAPPPWVRETTEAELMRRGLVGSPRLSPSGVGPTAPSACSDAATRGLNTRRRLWAKQLDRSVAMTARLQSYEAAKATCEIRRWRDQKAFLDLLQQRASTEAEIRLLLGHFADDPDAKTFLTQALLRRLIDPSLIATVIYAEYGAVDWFEVDARLQAAKTAQARLEILDQALRAAPGDPDGERRMIREFVAIGRVDEAITRGQNLRNQGLLTPDLIVLVGDLLAREGRDEEARRLYSELVEYAPDSEASRRLLGDLFLRHGWYADAFRQYELLFDMRETPVTAIRMARAAAGNERGDKARRLLERVFSGEGRPGADDPRRWARLHAAAILAASVEDEEHKKAVAAELKALNLFDGPGTWELLSWDDLGATLVLAPPPTEPGSDERRLPDADRVEAKGTGLFAVLPAAAEGDPDLVVRHAGLVPDRDVRWKRIRLSYDGETFTAVFIEDTIEARQVKAEPEQPAEGSEDDAAEPADENPQEDSGN
ncbi:protein containing a von Willebrand factor type A domain [Plesiocystis pacifica SIR-1]|uniref:Protein containing a von Willebrand factor type A domain n=1 Tax=Plesiocystis pacifica SIR-1 TaxID=391625 RepID=A6GAF0_9BACT|nr:VWA domain-containing protein [Plesiocystis pacifica]EDM77138.1 protein containing a von Willebrand factor type A domain [Plesiocystis pacifica SIR-1]